MKFGSLLLSVAVMLSFQACNNKPKENNATDASFPTQQTKKVTNEYVLKGLDGTTLTLVRTAKGFLVKEYPHKTVLFNVISTECSPCQKEAKVISTLQESYQADLLILTLLTDPTPSALTHIERFVQPFEARNFISNSPTNLSIVNMLLKDSSYGSLESLSLPFKVLLKNGKQVPVFSEFSEIKEYFIVGQIYPEMLETEIKKILGK